MISITEAGRDTAENGRDPHLELHSDSKVCVSVCVLCGYMCVQEKKKERVLQSVLESKPFVCHNCWKSVLSRRNCLSFCVK